MTAPPSVRFEARFEAEKGLEWEEVIRPALCGMGAAAVREALKDPEGLVVRLLDERVREIQAQLALEKKELQARDRRREGERRRKKTEALYEKDAPRAARQFIANGADESLEVWLERYETGLKKEHGPAVAHRCVCQPGPVAIQKQISFKLNVRTSGIGG